MHLEGRRRQPIDDGCLARNRLVGLSLPSSLPGLQEMEVVETDESWKSELVDSRQGKAGEVEDDGEKEDGDQGASEHDSLEGAKAEAITDSCHVHWRGGTPWPEGLATAIIARMVLFRCLSQVNLPWAGRRGCPPAPQLCRPLSFPALLLVSEGSHPALAARGCKMLLPGFSTTVCPAPSLSPPNIPEVRSTGAWIGGASRDTERQPARLPGRSLTVSVRCRSLPAASLDNIPFPWIQGHTTAPCGACMWSLVSAIAVDVETGHLYPKRSGQVPGSSKDENCPWARISGIFVLGVPSSPAPPSLPRTLRAYQFA